jgi:hypothetical protein
MNLQMKKITASLIFILISNMVFAQHDHHSEPKVDSTKPAAKPKSPRKMAMSMVGDNHVHMDYGSPSVRGRTIWGGLVAYDQVWATGAHKATTIDFAKDVVINGKLIPKGKYGFFTIPNAKEWTLIINKVWDMHLADDYNESNDLLRIKVVPQILKETVEELTFDVKDNDGKNGSVTLSWDKQSVSFSFANKM